MAPMRTRTAVLLCLLSAMCPVLADAPPSQTNPPPAARLGGHASYAIQPLEMGAPYRGDESSEKAKAKIQEHLDRDVAPLLAQWSRADKPEDSDSTLVLTPTIKNIRFRGSKRFWAGSAAGSSY